MTHRKAVLTMIAVTLLWSIAGVATRHLEQARGFEVNFWRSAFNALSLVVLLSWQRGPAPLWRDIAGGGRALWLSSVCWCVMYTAFMLALTLTTVANTLITMATAPLFTALTARLALGHRLPARTWAAVAAAGAGIAYMFGRDFTGAQGQHLAGTVVALGVPVAAAINWTLLQHVKTAPGSDMVPAVLIGAVLSAVLTLPLALPLAATPHDLGILGVLGLFQLAVPCLLAVAVARHLSAPEISLLALLEVIFGVAWAWIGAGEALAPDMLVGGAVVLLALAANEAFALRRHARPSG